MYSTFFATHCSEHIIDQKLLTSARVTERLKLWDEFHKGIDEATIKFSFLDKTHEAPNDSDVVEECKRIRVPESIKSMYKNRALADLSAKNHITVADPDIARAIGRQQLVDNNIEPPSTADVECWFGGIVELQSSLAEYITRHKSAATESKTLNGKEAKKSVNAWMDDTNYAWKKVASDVTRSVEVKSEIASDVAQSLEAIENNLTASNSAADDLVLDNLDSKLIRALALQRLRQIVPRATNTETGDPCSVIANCNSMTKRSVSHGEVRARALLCPVYMNPSGEYATGTQSCPMRFRTLSIGLGEGNQLDLANYGRCNYVSAKHACIYFDEVSAATKSRKKIIFFFNLCTF